MKGLVKMQRQIRSDRSKWITSRGGHEVTNIKRPGVFLFSKCPTSIPVHITSPSEEGGGGEKGVIRQVTFLMSGDFARILVRRDGKVF